MHLLSRIPSDQKRYLRSTYRKYERLFVRTFRSYGPERLIACLRSLGIHEGDCVLLHSAFNLDNGFCGNIEALIDTFILALGKSGTLLMVSLPFRSSSYEYLSTLDCFDVRSTPSQMGLLSEQFRRRPGVLRSLHPTHPVLAYGPKADWIVADHERCPYPCGPGTPFEKLLSLDGAVLFFDVPFSTFTFVHYLEHLMRDRLPFPLYSEKVFQVPVIDHAGAHRTVAVAVFSQDAIRRRRFPLLEAELRRRRMLREQRLGNTQILSVHASDAVECAQDMAQRNTFFYDLSDVFTNPS